MVESLWRSGEMGVWMTRQDFGADLYEAIWLFAGREQVRHYLRARPPQKRRIEFQKREKELSDQILVLMPTLSSDDQRRLLDRYESQGAA